MLRLEQEHRRCIVRGHKTVLEMTRIRCLNRQVRRMAMVDELKHLDGHGDEIHDLVETANAKQYCPKCVVASLLEWAAYAAIRAGATAGEVTSALANGIVMAEEENEWMETEPIPEIRH